VQLYLSTPTIEKFGPRGIGRYLHRRAIDGIVPSKVAWRMTKRMGSPVGRHLDPRDLADWGRILRERMPSDVAAVIDPDKLDRLICGLEGTPDYEYRALCRRTFTSLSSVSRWLE
jgi:asparagine synthase (glutamine-hydrolysing)